MRNLDDGGGINDDAGGGENGGPHSPEGAPERLQQLAKAAAAANHNHAHPHHNHHHQRSTFAKKVLSSSSEEDDDNGRRQAEDGEAEDNTCSSNIRREGVTTSPQLAPMVEATDTLCAQSNSSAGRGGESKQTRALTNLIDDHKHGAPCSSGYNSSDNYELATTNSSSALTDSMRLIANTRTDSPIDSCATEGPTRSGRDSVVTFAGDFVSIAQHHAPPITPASADTLPIDLYLESRELLDDIQSDRSGESSEPSPTSGPAQANNNRKFEENAEDVADDVNEFGCRDSYGEDGYDSSTVSFDSYDDADDDDDKVAAAAAHEAGTVGGSIDCDNSEASVEDDVAYYGDDNDEAYDQQVVGPTQLNHRDVIKSTDKDNSGADKATVADHQHHNHTEPRRQHFHSQTDSTQCQEIRDSLLISNNVKQHHRKQANSLKKQADVFQAYISLEHRTELVDTWRLAVTRSMQWTKVRHEEIRRIDYQRLSSLPISMYVFLSLGLVALSGFLSPSSAIFSPARI